MNEKCPISGIKVNEKVVRANALVVFILSLVYLFTQYKWVILLLAVDFLFKGFMNPKYSPISKINANILNMMKVAPNMVDSGPKTFAAKIGFICSFAISILYYGFALTVPAEFIAAMLIACAFLEGFLGYCVGCKLYSLFYRNKTV